MKLRWVFKVIAAALAAGAMSAAHAAATLSFQVDGGAIVQCADGTACDLNPVAGVVTFSGDLGGGFLVNVSTGLSKPLLNGMPVLMDLNSVDVNVDAGAHTLTIMFSDTDFLNTGSLFGEFGGTLSTGAGGTITAEAFYSLDNALFDLANSLGEIGPFGSGPFSGSTSGTAVGWAPYSLTQVLRLTTNGFTVFSGDASINVPEPGTLALTGLALLALAGRRRRD
jgi:hypothetical protein